MTPKFFSRALIWLANFSFVKDQFSIVMFNMNGDHCLTLFKFYLGQMVILNLMLEKMQHHFQEITMKKQV